MSPASSGKFGLAGSRARFHTGNLIHLVRHLSSRKKHIHRIIKSRSGRQLTASGET